MSRENEVAEMNEIRGAAKLELKAIEKKLRSLNVDRNRVLKIIQKNSVANICLKYNLLTYDVLHARKE